MGIRHNVEEGLDKYEITKIDEQPTDEFEQTYPGIDHQCIG
jgi:hypothetical protein